MSPFRDLQWRVICVLFVPVPTVRIVLMIFMRLERVVEIFQWICHVYCAPTVGP